MLSVILYAPLNLLREDFMANVTYQCGAASLRGRDFETDETDGRFLEGPEVACNIEKAKAKRKH